jgi:hypothetical protein
MTGGIQLRGIRIYLLILMDDRFRSTIDLIHVLLSGAQSCGVQGVIYVIPGIYTYVLLMPGERS